MIKRHHKGPSARDLGKGLIITYFLRTNKRFARIHADITLPASHEGEANTQHKQRREAD